MSETDNDRSSWLTKQQAADAIGCSTKHVERLAQAGKLQQDSWSPQGRGPARAVYHPADVARLAQGRRTAPAPFVLPAGAGNGHGNGESFPETSGSLTETLARVPAGDDPIRLLFAAALRAVMSQTSETLPVSETLFLTLAEAAAASGLSQAYLRRKIADGTLKAEKDRGWKIRRRDLEAL